MRHKKATNGEPGLVVEMTTPLAYFINHQFKNKNNLVCLNMYLVEMGWLTICGLFVPHQGVSGVVISTTRAGSPFVASLCPIRE